MDREVELNEKRSEGISIGASKSLIGFFMI